MTHPLPFLTQAVSRYREPIAVHAGPAENSDGGSVIEVVHGGSTCVHSRVSHEHALPPICPGCGQDMREKEHDDYEVMVWADGEQIVLPIHEECSAQALGSKAAATHRDMTKVKCRNCGEPLCRWEQGPQGPMLLGNHGSEYPWRCFHGSGSFVPDGDWLRNQPQTVREFWHQIITNIPRKAA